MYFIQCKTDSMPGSYAQKIPLMADAACQKPGIGTSMKVILTTIDSLLSVDG